MTRYVLDEEAYKYLDEWTSTRRDAVKLCIPFDKKAEVILSEYKELKYITEVTTYGYKFSLLYNKQQVAKGKITQGKESGKDFDLQFKLVSGADEETTIHFIQVFTVSFIEANSFMFYGNLVENKMYVAVGQNENETKIITFRKFKDKIYAVPIGHHKSPEGVFQVRGHFRKYSDGKVVWIDAYLKGIENE